MYKKSAPDKKLTAKQHLSINKLLTGSSREEAALAANVHTRTLSRWLNSPDCENYQIELQKRQTRAIGYASVRLTGGIDVAASYLLEVIQDTTAPPSVRVRAALGWLDKQLKFVEQNEIITRLDALEAVTT